MGSVSLCEWYPDIMVSRMLEYSNSCSSASDSEHTLESSDRQTDTLCHTYRRCGADSLYCTLLEVLSEHLLNRNLLPW